VVLAGIGGARAASKGVQYLNGQRLHLKLVVEQSILHAGVVKPPRSSEFSANVLQNGNIVDFLKGEHICIKGEDSLRDRANLLLSPGRITRA
jgi:hypothetical protein